MKGAPSRLHANEAGSFALKENFAVSPEGSPDRLVSGGVRSSALAEAEGVADEDADAELDVDGRRVGCLAADVAGAGLRLEAGSVGVGSSVGGAVETWPSPGSDGRSKLRDSAPPASRDSADPVDSACLAEESSETDETAV